MQSQNHLSSLNMVWSIQKYKMGYSKVLTNPPCLKKSFLSKEKSALLNGQAFIQTKTGQRSKNLRAQSLSSTYWPKANQQCLSYPLNCGNQKKKTFFSYPITGFLSSIGFQKDNRQILNNKNSNMMLLSNPQKRKSKKLTNFLQFLLYQDFKKMGPSMNHNSVDKGFSDNFEKESLDNLTNKLFLSQKGIQKNLLLHTRGSNSSGDTQQNVDKFSNGLLISGFNKKTPNYLLVPQKKWSSFFPYRKSFLSYWLLPAMGFVSYMSSSYYDHPFFFCAKSNPVDFRPSHQRSNQTTIDWSSNGLYFNSQPYNDLERLSFEGLKKEHRTFLNTKEINRHQENQSLIGQKELENSLLTSFFSSSFQKGLTEVWYKTCFIYNLLPQQVSFSNFYGSADDCNRLFLNTPTNLPSSLPIKASLAVLNPKKSYFYPDKFYRTPLNQATIKRYYLSGPSSLSILKKDSFFNPPISNLREKNQTTKKKGSVKGRNLSFLTSSQNLTNKLALFTIPSTPKKHQTNKKDAFLGIKRKALKKSHFLQNGLNKNQGYLSSSWYDQKSLAQFKRLSNLKPLNSQPNNLFSMKNPLFSYKKASFLMDEYFKALVFPVNGNPETRFVNMNGFSQAQVRSQTREDNPYQQKLDRKGMISKAQASFPGQVLSFQNQNPFLLPVNPLHFKVDFPFYFKKIENSYLSSFLKSEQYSIHHSFTKKVKKVSFLEEMISFLAYDKYRVQNQNKLTKAFFSNNPQKEQEIDLLLFQGNKANFENLLKQSPLNGLDGNKIQKLSKDQCYSMILNAFTKSIDLLGTSFEVIIDQTKIKENLVNETKASTQNHQNGITLTIGSTPFDLKFKNQPFVKKYPVFKFNHPLMFSTLPELESALNNGLSPVVNISNDSLRELSESQAKLFLTREAELKKRNLLPDEQNNFLQRNNQKALENTNNQRTNQLTEFNWNFSFNYVNFLSFKLKQIVTPFYPLIFKKETNNFFDKGQSKLFLEPQGEFKNQTQNQKRIEKIMRSYLSKKRKTLAYNPPKLKSGRFTILSSLTQVNKKGEQSLTSSRSNPLCLNLVKFKAFLGTGKKLAIKKKTSLCLWTNKHKSLVAIMNPQKKSIIGKTYLFNSINTSFSNQYPFQSEIQNQTKKRTMNQHLFLSKTQSSTLNTILKNRSFLLKKIKRPVLSFVDLSSEGQVLLKSDVSLSSFQKSLVEQKFSKSQFDPSFSSVEKKNTPEEQANSYFEKLEKRKYAQKKHRRKKQRKETRRRKKRKRFYPRPSWSRYQMYQNILKRLSSPTNPNNTLCARSMFQVWNIRSCQLPEASKLASYKNPALLDSGSMTLLTPSLRNGGSIDQRVKDLNKGPFVTLQKINSKKGNRIDLLLNQRNTQLNFESFNTTMISLGHNCFLETLPLYSTKDFYQIKRSVLGELKRSFWKSYWLRSNLNPYLNQIQMHLKQIEKSSTQETLYFNLRSLILSLSGLTKHNMGDESFNWPSFKSSNLQKQSIEKENLGSILPTVKSGDSNFYTNLHFLTKDPCSALNVQDQSYFRIIDSNAQDQTSYAGLDRASFAQNGVHGNSSNLGLYLNPLHLTTNQNINSHLGANLNFSFTNNKWQLITQISEHNRIMYDRIQNLILNIRENLTLNGHFKARPYKRTGHQKFKSLSSLKQNNPNNPQSTDFWSKLGKTTTSILTQSSPKYYGNFSTNRLYWAIHKSNLGSFQNLNKIKTIWMNTKNREQSKANKTKKIFYDIKKRSSSFFDNSLIEQKFLFNLFNQPNVGQSQLNFDFTENGLSNINSIGADQNIVLCSKPSLVQAKQTITNSSFQSTQNPNLPYSGLHFSTEGLAKLKSSLQVSERKLRQKEQKLNFLGLSNAIVNSPGSNLFKKNNVPLPLLNKGSSPQNREQASFNLFPGHIKKFTNGIHFWWNESKMKFVPRFNNDFSLEGTSVLSSVSSSGPSFNLTNQITTLAAVTFLFHFCAFISLISISQIRDFLKFVLIVSSKVSKIYFHLIDSSLNCLVDCFNYLGLAQWKKVTKNRILDSGFKFHSSLASVSCTPFSKGTQKQESLELFQNSRFLKNGSQIQQKETNSNLLYYQLVSFSKLFSFPNSKNVNTGKSNVESYTNEFLTQNGINLNSKVTIPFSELTVPKLNVSHRFNPQNLEFQISKREIPTSNSAFLPNVSSQFQKDPFKKVQILLTILTYSIVNALIFSLSNFSFLTYSYFLKSLNFIESFVRSIYTFLEKPGELIIDWMAYFFLVEWSSDLTNTIPDTLDTTFSNSIKKFSQSVRFPLLPTTYFSTEFGNQILGNASLTKTVPLPFSSSLNWTFSLLSSGLIQRRLLSMYEIFLNIACRPDTDLMSRQQKGSIFWDLWSDLLIGVAEDSNINVSELSNLKEEQNRLLEKLISLEAFTFNKELSFSFNQVDSLQAQTSVIDFNLVSFYGPPAGAHLISASRSNQHLGSPSSIMNSILISSLNNVQHQKQGQGGDIINKVTQIRKQNLTKAISWSTSQFLSYQGKDTELFIDLHPPKSFSHITSIKYSESINQPIGLVLCQIFSGLFYKQIAKNLLVVGPPGNEKSMLIQAIAGETELKMITDNAHRYAMVFRGVAVGIKLLRDVFEALTLHTPCLFLLEDIHAIGERRPFLISDDENSKGTESSIYQDRDEIHEKNQVIYQLTKHIISHYKKPYKGDFSLLIPTNHFCFDLFNSTAINVQRNKTTLTPSSPLSLASKSSGSSEKLDASFDSSSNQFHSRMKASQSVGSWPPLNNTNGANYFESNSHSFASSLQLPKNQLLAPPATSPFSVLVLKEEKKLKPKKIVKEFPWAGLPGEQYANLSKATYSIRVKVALLADMVLSNLSVKLDMITDLLVIIDSVKGNRGFVVFATTHVPYILDPALRRPGRFDETLSLPQIPNLLSRWHISKKNISLSHYSNSTLKKSPSSSLMYGEPFSIYPIGISISLWQTNHYCFQSLNSILNTFNGQNFASSIGLDLDSLAPFDSPLGNQSLENPSVQFNQSKTRTGNLPNKLLNSSNFNKKRIKRNFILLKALNLSFNHSSIPDLYKGFSHVPFFNYLKQKKNNSLHSFQNISTHRSIDLPLTKNGLNPQNLKPSLNPPGTNKRATSSLTSVKQKSLKRNTILTLRVYSIVSKIFISLQQCRIVERSFNQNQWGDFSLSIMNSDSNSFYGATINRALSKDSLSYTSLYASPHIFKQHLTILMAGHIGSSIAKGNLLSTQNTRIDFVKTKAELNLIGNSTKTNKYGTQFQLASLMNLAGIDKTWKTATSLVFSFIQKRWIYGKSSAKKNLIVPRLLDFGLEGQKAEIPNPPSSNILLPSKRYENFKRTFTYSQLKGKTRSSINNQIQLHQQQRLVKRLYNIPLKEYFRSEILTSFNQLNQTSVEEKTNTQQYYSSWDPFNSNQNSVTNNNQIGMQSLTNQPNNFTSFSNASIILTPLENIQQKPTSMNWYFRHRLLNRHHTYLSNQWWNGQLQEHNTESTFLSDIDWRYTIRSTKEGGMGDLFIDFPDAEQYYNPKNQRWINTSGSWNSWFEFQKTAYEQYSSHYSFECITNAYKCLDQNRELLDYYVINILEKGMGTGKELDELDILELFEFRFYRTKS
jgi:SpoVK/Ycf46/Vps4 family AAA+-type ATPase